MKTYRLVNVGGVVASILAAAGSTWAQTAPAPAPAPAPAAAPAPAPAPAPAAEAAPAPAPAPAAAAQVEATPAPAQPAPAAAVAGESDHDMMVGRFALGYLGMRSMLIGAGFGVEAGTGEQPTNTVTAPVIGMRFWASQVVGIDGGIGFYTNWGSNSTDLRYPVDPVATQATPNGAAPVSTTLSGTTAFLVHIGVPLALAGAKHFSFQVTPEANIGFASQSVNSTNPLAPTNISNSGLHFDVGGRAGAELHFGFIGVPQLSLQGGIGILFAVDSTKTSQGAAGESKRSRGSLGTTVNDNPWNIFITNVAALYYF